MPWWCYRCLYLLCHESVGLSSDKRNSFLSSTATCSNIWSGNDMPSDSLGVEGTSLAPAECPFSSSSMRYWFYRWRVFVSYFISIIKVINFLPAQETSSNTFYGVSNHKIMPEYKWSTNTHCSKMLLYSFLNVLCWLQIVVDNLTCVVSPLIALYRAMKLLLTEH